MITLVVIGLALAYLISWVMYQKYQFKERDLYSTDGHNAYEANKMWHKWKGANQFCVYALVFMGFGFKMMMIFAVLFWAGFDLFVNKLVLNRPWLFVGTTADTDLFIRKVADKIHIKPEYTSLLIKVAILLATFILL
jgi:NADH:ubiquinone oxidoreductase subunit 3 (subunit A)